MLDLPEQRLFQPTALPLHGREVAFQIGPVELDVTPSPVCSKVPGSGFEAGSSARVHSTQAPRAVPSWDRRHAIRQKVQ